jgi:hypothetical protein
MRLRDLLRDFTDHKFLKQAKSELERRGFVTNEHRFAPYRDTLVEHVHEIEKELKDMGYRGTIKAGKLKHKYTGTAFYLYDSTRYDESAAAQAVKKWIEEQYGEDI